MGHGKHSPNEMGHSPNEMSRELEYMPAVEDMTGQRASSIVNAGVRSRMGSPAMKQGYNARLDESLAKDGKESTMTQSLEDRRDESKGMKISIGKGEYSSDPQMS